MAAIHSEGICVHRKSILAGVAGLVLVTAATAQSPAGREDDLLDQVKRKYAVAAQKLEANLTATLREAQRLVAHDPGTALANLKVALLLIQDDTALSPERRESWKRTIQERMRAAELAVYRAGGRAGSPLPPTVRGTGDERQTILEQGKIERELSIIRGLERDGRSQEAGRLANDLARRYPSNPAVLASSRNVAVASQIISARRQLTERERSLVGAFGDVARSATLPSGDMDFPKDWHERTKGRSNQVPLTAKEKAIVLALGSPITVNLQNKPLQEVIDYIQDRIGLPILLDRTALEEQQVTYDTPVSVNVKGVALRTLLRKVLSELGLNYVIKDEAIQVTTAMRAKEAMVVRSYYIADIAISMNSMNLIGPFPWGPTINQLQTVDNINRLIDTIQSSVDPASWRPNGGNGTIAYYAPSMSLIIKQSAEVHAQLAGSLLR